MKHGPGVTGIAPVRKSVVVGVEPESAFTFFTGRMDAWWPFAGHSLFVERAKTVEFEPREGGGVWEVSHDGERASWGRLLEWDPPRRFRMTWHPGRAIETAQELEVRFVPVAGGTRVEIEHRGWERLAQRATETRDGYDQGWGAVLASFATAVDERAR
jgi:hypothetical protein